MALAAIDEVIAAIGRGEMIVLVDDEDRENEGDLVMAAEDVDEAAIAFMATRGCGLICLAMAGELVDSLHLPMMTACNRSRLGTAFTVSIEAATGVTTGISAADRARTVAAAVAPDAGPDDVVSPGHIFPLRAVDGGVLVRAGQTEGAVDLARFAGRRPAGVICEIMKPDGTMARRDDLEGFCAAHGLLMASVADLIAWREQRESLVREVATAAVQTAAGPARAVCFRSVLDHQQHLALVFAPPDAASAVEKPVLVRVQHECPLADVFAVPVPDQAPVAASLAALAAEGGVLLYLRDGLGPQLGARVAALAADGAVAEPDPRAYGIGAQILRALGVRRMRLLTDSSRLPHALAGHGLEIVEHVGVSSFASAPRRQ